MKKRLFIVLCLLSFAFSQVSFAEDKQVTVNLTKVAKTAGWIVTDVGCWVGAYVAYAWRRVASNGLLFNITPAARATLKATQWGLIAGGVAIPVYFIYKAAFVSNAVKLSYVTPEMLENQFLDIKEKRLAWEKAPENVYLKLDYLTAKKIYHESALDYVSSATVENKLEFSNELEREIVTIEREMQEGAQQVQGLSRSERVALLQEKADVEEGIDLATVRSELAQKLEDSLKALEEVSL